MATEEREREAKDSAPAPSRAAHQQAPCPHPRFSPRPRAATLPPLGFRRASAGRDRRRRHEKTRGKHRTAYRPPMPPNPTVGADSAARRRRRAPPASQLRMRRVPAAAATTPPHPLACATTASAATRCLLVCAGCPPLAAFLLPAGRQRSAAWSPLRDGAERSRHG